MPQDVERQAYYYSETAKEMTMFRVKMRTILETITLVPMPDATTELEAIEMIKRGFRSSTPEEKEQGVFTTRIASNLDGSLVESVTYEILGAEEFENHQVLNRDANQDKEDSAILREEAE